MRRIFFLAAGLGLAWSAPGLAQSACTEPTPPPPLDGTVAHEGELRAALAQARNYIAQAGVYQECLLDEVSAIKAQDAADGIPFEPAIEVSAHVKVDASKKSQEKVGAAANRALTAYKLAHAN